MDKPVVDKSNKIISDLMIQLGTAIGALKAIILNPGITDDALYSLIITLEENAQRIIKETGNEVSS